MKHRDKVPALLSGLLFLIVVSWILILDNSPRDSVPLSVPAKTFSVEPVGLEVELDEIDWGPPEPKGGQSWIFDIFTPPVIFYDERTKTFTVTPPYPKGSIAEEKFELQLIEVEAVPYRFQLVSYAGSAGNFVLTLEDLESGKDVICSPQELLWEHEMQVISFAENRVIASSTRAGTTEAFDFVGVAVINDLRSGEQHTLRHNQRVFLEEPNAVFESSAGEILRLGKGDAWQTGDVTYTVRSIALNNQSAAVEKTSKDKSEAVVRVLRSLRNASDLSKNKPRNFDPPSETF